MFPQALIMHNNIFRKTHEIAPGMNVDVEFLEQLRHTIYTYKYNNEVIKIKDVIYSVCYYFDDLMNNVADTTPLVRFFMDFVEHCNYIEVEAMRIKKELFAKIPDIFTTVFDSDPEIFILEPLERQTNAPPPDEPSVGLVIDFMSNWRVCTYHKNQMQYATCAYVNKLANKISYVKSQIIKFELARFGKMSGTVLDILINEMFGWLIDLKDEMRKYTKRELALNYDQSVAEMRYHSHEQSISQVLFEQYRGCCTLYPYNLPRSVINDCADKPDLWNVVCKEKGIFGKVLKCPGSKQNS